LTDCTRHTPWAGAANIEDGVTIDLSRLDQVLVSKDRSTVTIGPGNRWRRVYEELAPQGLVVAGGRVATVGVSGLILGGKSISY
jgi:FAD/FMN-containing dehydrogenase